MTTSILHRITGLVLVATLVPAIAFIGGSLYLNQQATDQMNQRIEETLTLAINLEQSLIDSHLARMRDQAVAMSAGPAVLASLVERTPTGPLMERFAEALGGADLTTLVDRNGQVLGRAGSDMRSDVIRYGGLVPSVIESGAPASAVVRITRDELSSEPRAVLAQVRIPVLTTEASTDPRAGTMMEDALALVAAAPVRDAAGRVIGAVVLADILNNDHQIVDGVTSRSPLGMPMHATIALDGVRVTTNVPAPGGGKRAVGTLYSDVVMDKLRANEAYRGRALVGGHVWERTIYLPMVDHTGKVVGGSFVGVPEESFTALTRRTANTTQLAIAVALATLAIAGFVSYRLALHGLVRPLQGFAAVLAGGDLHTRVESQAILETSELAEALNTMTARIRRTVAEIARVSGGVRSASDTLALEARQTSANADGALQVAAGALEAAEAVGEQAQRTMGRVRELELTLARIGTTAREQARAIRHAGNAVGLVEGAMGESRRMLTAVLESTQAAVNAVQQGRHSSLRAVAALELVRLAAPPGPGDVRLMEELDRAQATANDLSDAFREVARATEEARNRLWELAAVLTESSARVGAVTQQVSDMAGVADETAARIGTTGAESSAMLDEVEAMAGGISDGVVKVREAQGHVLSITESNRTLSELSNRIRDLAHELDQVAGGLTRDGGRAGVG